MNIKTVAISVCLLLSQWAHAEAPTIAPTEDAKHLAPIGSPILFWNAHQKVAGFRNIAALNPTRPITAGSAVKQLPESLQDLADVKVALKDAATTVDDYFTQKNVAGLLVIKNGNIVYERYGLGNDEDSLWVSFSVAKSVVSMLVGAAIQDGYIKSVDEKVTDYLPRLKGSSYDQVTIKNLLQMASGVAWNEDYADRSSDVATANWETLPMYEQLRHKPRVAEAGEVFNYNTSETNLIGTLLRSAIGNNLATYLTQKIWQPFGMQADANWQLTEAGGGEFGGCCINATLRDYARLGLFALNNGQAGGEQVLPENWIKESTSSSKGADHYGYFWWLNPDGTYEAMGIFGQGIYVNPNENVVIAIHSARDVAGGGFDLQTAMFTAIAASLGD